VCAVFWPCCRVLKIRRADAGSYSQPGELRIPGENTAEGCFEGASRIATGIDSYTTDELERAASKCHQARRPAQGRSGRSRSEDRDRRDAGPTSRGRNAERAGCARVVWFAPPRNAHRATDGAELSWRTLDAARAYDSSTAVPAGLVSASPIFVKTTGARNRLTMPAAV
jgi:hypothetical protein